MFQLQRGLAEAVREIGYCAASRALAGCGRGSLLRDARAEHTKTGEHSFVCECSILLCEHDRDDPLGDGGIGWIGRMHRQALIEIIDLEHDQVAVGFK